MADFKRKTITTKGKELVARITANETRLIFTKIESSDYLYTENVDIRNILNIDNPKQSVNISDVTKENSKVKIHAIFTNEGLLNSYNMNAIGVYAKDENDIEILFAILTTDRGDVMTAQHGGTVTSITFDLVFNISDTENISILVDSNALVTVNMLNIVKENINNNYVKNTDYATEQKHGIAKLYSETESETDSEKIREIVERNTGNDRGYVEDKMTVQEYERRMGQGERFDGEVRFGNDNEPGTVTVRRMTGDTVWGRLIKTLDHTKILTVKGLIKILRKIIKPASETGYGLTTNANIKSLITTHAPRPDLSPYMTWNKGYRNGNNTDWVVRTNNHITWASYNLEMWNGDNGHFMGAFHTNGGRAYYKVPSRNGGNWNEIMDNHDMAIRDNNIQHAHNRITETYNRANDAWHKSHDAQHNRVQEIRLAGFVSGIIYHQNVGHERSGYVVTGVVQTTNDTILDVIQMRAIQFLRNGQWINAYFA